MPKALDRLLISPSALRTLRTLINTRELSATCFPTVNRCQSTVPRRGFFSGIKPPKKLKIRKVPLKAEVEKDARSSPPQAPSIDRESNVNDPELYTLGTLKIDNAVDSEKTALWVEILVYRARVYGHKGIRDVFLGMGRREYTLPTADTSDSALLWGTLLKHPKLVVAIIDQAARIYKDTGELYPRLYEKCMAHWLPRHPKMAQQYHHDMLMKLRLRKLPLRQLAQVARTSFAYRSFEAFMDIYRTSNERDVYDEIVPALCDRGEFTLARRWHSMCFHRKDRPSASVASHPIVQLLIAESSTISSPNTNELIGRDEGTASKRLAIKTGTKEKKQKTSTQEKKQKFLGQQYNQELLRRLTGRDTAPVRFEDPFCARLFATRAFPPASIIKGLTMVGVNEIGPQALRAMGLRTEPKSDLPERFRELRESGIALQGSVFSLALEKFAMEGRFDLVQNILDSDQHPDVFGDAEIQKNLLSFYLENEDWPQAHRTLAILALFHNDANTESWNLMLQARIRRLHPRQLVKVLTDMHANEIMVSKESMSALRTILRRRQAGRRPALSTHGRFDDLRFLARVYMMISESGMGIVFPLAWREIVRRFGMLGRFRELKRLLFWLLSWYTPKDSAAFTNLPRSPLWAVATSRLRQEFPERYQYMSISPRLSTKNPMHPIQQLFPVSLQQALIAWGFRVGLLPNASWEQSMLSTTAAKKHFRKRLVQNGVLQQVDWTIGLRTLVELRDLGLHVHPHTVVKALQLQFVVLFGQRRSRLRVNRIMEDVNTIPYDEYVREVNRIWGSPLFLEPERMGRANLYGMSWHPLLRRMPKRRTYLMLDEILGPGWCNHAPAPDGNVYDKEERHQVSAPSQLGGNKGPSAFGSLEDGVEPGWTSVAPDNTSHERDEQSDAIVAPSDPRPNMAAMRGMYVLERASAATGKK